MSAFAPEAPSAGAFQLLYADRDLAVAVKPVGVASEQGTGGMPSLIAGALSLREEQVYPVHRLDAVTGGVMVYALNSAAAAALSSAVQSGGLRKTYLAVAEGDPGADSGDWRDLLFWDIRSRKAYTVDRPRKGAKEARLLFERLALREGLSLLRLTPLTGRTHQIRVQCASRRLPLHGDRRYGARQGRSAALWACALSFPHPRSGQPLRFTAFPDWNADPWRLFSGLPPQSLLPPDLQP